MNKHMDRSNDAAGGTPHKRLIFMPIPKFLSHWICAQKTAHEKNQTENKTKQKENHTAQHSTAHDRERTLNAQISFSFGTNTLEICRSNTNRSFVHLEVPRYTHNTQTTHTHTNKDKQDTAQTHNTHDTAHIQHTRTNFSKHKDRWDDAARGTPAERSYSCSIHKYLTPSLTHKWQRTNQNKKKTKIKWETNKRENHIAQLSTAHDRESFGPKTSFSVAVRQGICQYKQKFRSIRNPSRQTQHTLTAQTLSTQHKHTHTNRTQHTHSTREQTWTSTWTVHLMQQEARLTSVELLSMLIPQISNSLNIRTKKNALQTEVRKQQKRVKQKRVKITQHSAAQLCTALHSKRTLDAKTSISVRNNQIRNLLRQYKQKLRSV